MSLTWNFNQRAGVIFLPSGRMLTCYQGNAYLIILNETETDYTLVSFWADAQHMKNCLGLSKGFSNCYTKSYDDWTGSKWVLYKDNCKNTSKIAEALVRAFVAVTVQVFPSAPQVREYDARKDVDAG